MVESQVTRPHRQLGILGIVFTVLFVVGFLSGAGTPEYDAPDQEWIDWFDDEGNRSGAIASAFVMVAASLAFIWFAALLSRVLRERLSPTSALPTVAVASATAAAVCFMIGAMLVSSIAAALTFAPEYDQIPSPELLKATEQLGIGLGLVAGPWAAALMVLAVSAAARTTGLLAPWLATAGFVVAVVMLFSFLFIPLLLFVIWMLVVSITFWRQPFAAPPPAPAEP